MNRIYFNEESYNALIDWVGTDKSLYLDAKPYFKRVNLYMEHERLYMNVTAKADGTYKFSLIDGKETELKGYLKIDESKKNDYAIKFRPYSGKEINEDNTHAMQVFLTFFLHANAFLWYGNVIDKGNILARGKNESEINKTIVFRVSAGKTYAVATREHKSPEGVFSVRGHFRKYKSGKLVWIDEYMKGTE